ncbi:MAG: ATP-binding protein, partial [Lentisphaerae bacterium]|nr:ATP-binding protein [Lentisphaerota bacterium]
TMSYLTGPLTRTQIKTLMDPRRPAETVPAAAAPAAGAAAATAAPAPAPAASAPPAQAAAARPETVPAEVPQFYLPIRGAAPTGAVTYRPGVLAAATISFIGPDSGEGTITKIRRMALAPEGALALDWDGALPLETTVEELDRDPYPEVAFEPLPPAMEKLASYRSWSGDFSAWAFRTHAVEVLKSPGFKQTSAPGESEGEFRSRLQLAAREKRDDMTEQLRKKYTTKIATLQQRVQRAEHAVEREAEQAKGRKMQTAISFGATLMGAFLGRKVMSTSTLGRATTAMRDVGRSLDEAGDVKRAEETLETLKQKQADLEAQFQEEVDALGADLDPMTEELETALVRPRKSDITVDLVGLVWMPYRQEPTGVPSKAWE